MRKRVQPSEGGEPEWYRPNVLSPAEARALVERWHEAWERHDLDTLVSFYAEDVVVESASIVHRWGREDGIIRGREELREQLARGLEIVPEPSVLEDVFVTPSGYASLMRMPNGIRAVDVFHLDDENLIRSVTSLFSGDHR